MVRAPMSHATRQPIEPPESVPLTPPEDFAARLDALGVSLDATAIARLGDYLARLLAMNKFMNLTAITDPAEAWTRHALDALTLVPLLAELPSGAGVVDVGTGGGVPGIPLAIARPDLRVMLVEATQKKVAFLSSVIAALGLKNVSVRAQRAEAASEWELRGSFDVATARAVGRIAMLLPITAPFVKSGGRVLLIKGQRADEELEEAALVLIEQHCTLEATVNTPTGRIVVMRRGEVAPKPRARRSR